jgi:hypothetical protein
MSKTETYVIQYMRMAPLEKFLLYMQCLAIWLILARSTYYTFVSAG